MGKYRNSDIGKTIIQQLEEKNPYYLEAYRKTTEFFMIYDAIEGTNHERIFQCLFGEGKNRRKSINGIALEQFCSSRTLYRYIVKYVICFCCHLDLPKDQRPDS